MDDMRITRHETERGSWACGGVEIIEYSGDTTNWWVEDFARTKKKRTGAETRDDRTCC